MKTLDTLPEAGLRESYERDGYCVVPQLFEAPECRTWKDEALRVLSEHAKPSATVYVGAAASPVFYALASHPQLMAIRYWDFVRC